MPGPGWRWEAIPVQSQCCSPPLPQLPGPGPDHPLTGHHDQPLSAAVTSAQVTSHARMTQETRRGWSLSLRQLIQRKREAVGAETWETLFTRGFWAADHTLPVMVMKDESI